jgi:pantothenate kinase-related protein Tda10
MEKFKDYDHLSDIIALRISLSKSKRPLIIGVSGLQGLGKTFLSSKVKKALKRVYSIESFVCSIDDFYYPFKRLSLLGQNNPLFKYRGVPGTHDLGLVAELFDSHQNQTACKVPFYNKALNHGQGDRETFVDYVPCEVLIFEGWFLGISSVLLGDENPYKKYLECYDDVWAKVSEWVFLNGTQAQSLSCRLRAENMMEDGSKVNIERFMRFMWRAVAPDLLPKSFDSMGSKSDKLLRVQVNADFSGVIL